MFLQNVYALTSLRLKSIQLNNQKINYVLLQLQYVKYLNKASYLRKNDVVFMMKLGLWYFHSHFLQYCIVIAIGELYLSINLIYKLVLLLYN